MKTPVPRRKRDLRKRRSTAPSPEPPEGGEDQRDGVKGDASFPIVGIGASAGGLEAFTQLLGALPLDTGMGFVLVQHLDPYHESQLAQILSRATSLPVHEITNDDPVKPNHVYVIPRDTNLTIRGGVLKIQQRELTRAPHRPIDSFFETLAQDRRERAVGVVLSGTASDGTLGLEAIKAEGGITFAQDDSAKHDSMPRSAVAAGCVDLVLSPVEIAKELERISKHPYVAGQAPAMRLKGEASSAEDRAFATAHADDQTPPASGEHRTSDTGGKEVRAQAERGRGRQAKPGNRSKADKAAEEGYRKILLLLRNHSGVDFSLYKSSTIQRRITRRLVLNKQNTLSDYAAFLRSNAEELNALYSDVLISVTSFFRNPETFDVLQHKVLPELLRQRGDDPLRCWVLGCSTGQEAYSIAMTFVETAEEARHTRRLQIFATDLNDALLVKARHGLYAKSLVDDIAPQRLRRFFVEEDGGYRVIKTLREMVVFARQNLIADPAFSRMDLITCRNLLIYLEPSVQRKAIPTFHYALKPRGYLILGASESIGDFTQLFEPVDKKHKIYSKRPGPISASAPPLKRERREKQSLLRTPPPIARPARPYLPDGLQGEVNARREADRITVAQFAPPGVLVDAQLEVLEFRGPTEPFLELPAGKASFDVLKMAREGLMLPLRDAINQAKEGKVTTRTENVRVEHNGKARTVSLEIIPLRNLRERCFLILFEEGETTGGKRKRSVFRPPRTARSAREGPSRIVALETELAETREYLQATQEQQEAANEEAQAANEEVQSANEELQSVNEELETSKEELESTNEELITINEEMHNRNVEVNRLNNDLINLQTSSKLSIVLVGRDLTVQRFSLQAEKQFDLLATDIGRPISYIRHGLRAIQPAANREVAIPESRDSPLDLAGLGGQVIAEVSELEYEVLDRNNRWHCLRVRPYMTLDNRVDGAVFVLVNIDALKRGEQAIAAARDYAESIVETVREPLLVLDNELHVESANRSFYRTFHVAPAETIGKSFYELGTRQWDTPRLRELMEALVSQNTSINDFEVEHDFQPVGRRAMLINARRIQHTHPESHRILVAIEDITERKRLESELRQSTTELAEAGRRKNEFLAMLAHELRNPLSALSYGLHILDKIPDDDTRRQKQRAMMARQAKRIGTLLDQLLDIARVTSGKVELSKERVDLVDVVNAAVETVSSLVDGQRHSLTLSLPPKRTAFVIGDRVRLAQAVENLLTNAVKFTNEGGQISLSIELEEDRVRIVVRDNGIGMNTDFLPHVFEVFTQAPRPLDRAKGGLGLGLPLVQRLVEMHGGQATASSPGLGQGSSFVITLPRVLEHRFKEQLDFEDGKPPASRPAPTRHRRILVVDDQEDIRETLADLLREDGHQTLALKDGPAALEAISTFDPEVVLLDLGLPAMDGYEVARRVRTEHGEKRILLVAVTGYQSDAARLKEAGFDHHLIKPTDPSKLFALLTAWDSGEEAP